MTQSKKSDDQYTITLDDYVSGEDITINLDDNIYAGATTTYWAGDSVTDVVYSGSNDGTFTISASNDISFDNNYSWTLTEDTYILPNKVESMCKEYPALEKVWRNFKSVYDMVQQDYEGKKKAGEIDDDIPF